MNDDLYCHDKYKSKASGWIALSAKYSKEWPVESLTVAVLCTTPPDLPATPEVSPIRFTEVDSTSAPIDTYLSWQNEANIEIPTATNADCSLQNTRISKQNVAVCDIKNQILTDQPKHGASRANNRDLPSPIQLSNSSSDIRANEMFPELAVRCRPSLLEGFDSPESPLDRTPGESLRADLLDTSDIDNDSPNSIPEARIHDLSVDDDNPNLPASNHTTKRRRIGKVLELQLNPMFDSASIDKDSIEKILTDGLEPKGNMMEVLCDREERETDYLKAGSLLKKEIVPLAENGEERSPAETESSADVRGGDRRLMNTTASAEISSDTAEAGFDSNPRASTLNLADSLALTPAPNVASDLSGSSNKAQIFKPEGTSVRLVAPSLEGRLAPPLPFSPFKVPTPALALSSTEAPASAVSSNLTEPLAGTKRSESLKQSPTREPSNSSQEPAASPPGLMDAPEDSEKPAALPPDSGKEAANSRAPSTLPALIKPAAQDSEKPAALPPASGEKAAASRTPATLPPLIEPAARDSEKPAARPPDSGKEAANSRAPSSLPPLIEPAAQDSEEPAALPPDSGKEAATSRPPSTLPPLIEPAAQDSEKPAALPPDSGKEAATSRPPSTLQPLIEPAAQDSEKPAAPQLVSETEVSATRDEAASPPLIKAVVESEEEKCLALCGHESSSEPAKGARELDDQLSSARRPAGSGGTMIRNCFKMIIGLLIGLTMICVAKFMFQNMNVREDLSVCATQALEVASSTKPSEIPEEFVPQNKQRPTPPPSAVPHASKRMVEEYKFEIPELGEIDFNHLIDKESFKVTELNPEDPIIQELREKIQFSD